MTLITKLSRQVKHFLQDQNGNIAILFAIVLPIIVVLSGGVIDYALAMNNKGKIQHAADMALLAALKTYNDKDIAVADKLGIAQKVGKGVLNANIEALNVTLDKFELSFKQDENGNNLASVDWNTKNKTNFLKIIGIKDINIGDKIEAAMTPSTSKYVDLYIMVDLSSSMGVPATPQGITDLKAAKSCEFSCHEKHDTNKYARENGIVLRMDVVREAIKSIANKVEKLESNRSDQYRIGLYGFTTEGTTLLKPTEDMAKVKEVGGAIAVENAHTILKSGIDYLKEKAGEQGNGSSDDNRIKLAVFLSDGLHDENLGVWPYFSKTIADVDCNIGGSGGEIKLITVYTTYEPFEGTAYTDVVKDHANNIGPAMEACATDGAFFQTSNAAEIQAAFDEIFVEFTVAGDLKLTK